MRPISAILPKELVPLGTTPVLDFVLREAADAAIERICIIVPPGKPLLDVWIDSLSDDPVLGGLVVETVVQEEPKGLGEAILCAGDWLAGEPFAMLLPDNFLPSPDHRFADLIELYRHTGNDVIGVLELDSTRSGEYGNCGRIDERPLSHEDFDP